MKHLKLGLLTAAIATSSLTYAATQGTLGSTSTGDFDIIVALQDLVQISRLDDLNFGTYGGTGALNGAEQFCVYRNGTGAYQVTLTGSGAGSAFTIANGANTMAYTATYNDGTGAVPVTSGTVITGRAGHATSTNCGAADNSTVNISIAESVLQANPTGTYQGTLTLLVGPE